MKIHKFNKLFIILTIVLAFIAGLSRVFKLLSTISMACFGLWSIAFLFCLMANCLSVVKMKLDKRDYIIITIVSVLIMFYYGFSLLKYNDIYRWDSLNYYIGNLDLINSFKQSFFGGIMKIITSTFDYDYGYFLLSFTIFPFMITNKIEETFIFCYAITILIPIIITFYLNIKLITKKNNINGKKWLILCFLFITLFPLLHKAAIGGQPDFVGLIFLNLILLLTVDYDFVKCDYKRFFLITICAFCLIISRRWYMYWILGYSVAFFLFLIYEQFLNKFSNLKSVLKNAIKFLAICIVPVVLFLLPMWTRIIKQDFSGYVAWNIGGYGLEFKNQIGFLGIIFVILLISGAIYGLINKKLRKFTVLNVFTLIIEFVMFLRIQNMWYHQSLILLPCYFYLMMNNIVFIYNIKHKICRNCCFMLLLSIIVVNFVVSVNGIDSSIFTNISLKPLVRDDYNNVLEVTNFIIDNTEENDLVYINAAGYYSAQSFRSIIYPNQLLDSRIIYESAIDNIHGFPIESIATAKYIFVSNVRIESTGAKLGHIVPAINDALNNETLVKKKFKLVREFIMNDEITFYCYERIKPYDLKESNYWEEIFKEQSQLYPNLFGDRIDSFDKIFLENANIK